jgi:hypothetical protein
VAGLVRGDGGFLLEDHHVNSGRRQLAGHREADDAGPDDTDGLRRIGHRANRSGEVLIRSARNFV